MRGQGGLRGMKAIGARIARAVQRVFGVGRRILSGSYHAHLLKTPREVYRALAYMLMNVRKHFRQKHGQAPQQVRLDEASSARWFGGFSRVLPLSPSPSPTPREELASAADVPGAPVGQRTTCASHAFLPSKAEQSLLGAQMSGGGWFRSTAMEA